MALHHENELIESLEKHINLCIKNANKPATDLELLEHRAALIRTIGHYVDARVTEKLDAVAQKLSRGRF